jgi:hypothetical protein
MEQKWCKIIDQKNPMFGRIFNIFEETSSQFRLKDSKNDFLIEKSACNVYENTLHDLNQTFDVEDKFIEENEKVNLFELIETAFRSFGINNFKLGNYTEMFDSFMEFLNDDKKTNDISAIKIPYDASKLIYTRIKSDGTKEKKTYNFIKFLGKGTYNRTEIYEDEVGTKIIVRRSDLFNNWSLDKEVKNNIFLSFFENIKHIILYIMIRKKIGNYKFIPKPYFLGIDKDPRVFQVIMIMELGTMTLQKYIENNITNHELIKKQIFSIYYDLDKLAIFNFRHGDFKCNNIVLSNKLNPLIIDFGFCSFELEDELTGRKILFPSEKTNQVYYDLNMYPHYAQVHDILQLLSSFNFIENFDPNIFIPIALFRYNKLNVKNYLLEEKYIREVFNDLAYHNEYDFDLYKSFYTERDFDLTTVHQYYLDKRGINLRVYIEPLDLASNIGLNISDYLIENYEKKYLKYKRKYLSLLDKINKP